MDRQLYAIGQIVRVTAQSRSGPQTKDHFRIVRRYLIKSGHSMYHIRSIVDFAQRMVPEDELSVVMPNVSDRMSYSCKILQLFPQFVRLDGWARS